MGLKIVFLGCFLWHFVCNLKFSIHTIRFFSYVWYVWRYSLFRVFYAVLLCGFLLTTGPVIRVVSVAGMSGREGKAVGPMTLSIVSWTPLGLFSICFRHMYQGSGCRPSHLTSHDPSLGNPGFFTSHPSHPAHISAIADSSPPLPGR